MGKYDPLKEFLREQTSDLISLSFSQINELLPEDDKLPNSAYKYKVWWSNGGHVQSDAWLNAGYKSIGGNRSANCKISKI